MNNSGNTIIVNIILITAIKVILIILATITPQNLIKSIYDFNIIVYKIFK